MAAVTALLCACNGNDPSNPSNSGNSGNSGIDVHTQQGCMYVGITGFNNDLYHFTNNRQRRFEILNKSSLNQYTAFVGSLGMEVNTALYWAVEDNVLHLKECSFPSDISNVSIVTFTDGLDNGSSKFNNRYFDESKEEENLQYLHGLITSTKVNDIPLTAYTVGVKGHDVGDVEAFDKELKILADHDSHSYNIGMNELNETFQAIANDLYKQNVKPQLTIAFPPKGRKYRIVFDNVGTNPNDGAKSQLYIEGQLNADRTLSNVVYKNCQSASGNILQGSENAKGQYEFTLENFVKTNGDKVPTNVMTMWWYNSSKSEWNHESEFNNEADVKTEDILKSAAVMLILDCSESLRANENFAKVQNAAINFLNILASGNSGYSDNSGGNGNSGGGNDPDPSSTAYFIKHPWGTGLDEDWTWQEMTKSGSDYIYEGLWGGVGANINTTASNIDAEWYPESNISGASSLRVGEGVRFSYNPNSETLSVIKTGSSTISVHDYSIADWNNLPAEYVFSATCPSNAAYNGLKSVKIYADKKYINILMEPNMNEITNLSLVTFDVLINTDNSDNTGGFGAVFTDANTDILMEGTVFVDWNPTSYAPGVYKWTGIVGGDDWEDWETVVEEGRLQGCSSQYVNGKFEIQIDRTYIPATWNNSEFSIGVYMEQYWDLVGFLPLVSSTDYNPGGYTNKMRIRIDQR